MTNDHDELASAYLDGQTTPAEAERVQGDTDLGARVEALRAVADQLATELPRPEPAARRRHLALALDAFDELQAPVAGAPGDGDQAQSLDGDTPAPVARLDQARRERDGSGRAGRDHDGGRRRWPTPPAWMGAAAVLIVVVGSIGLVASQGDDSTSFDTASDDAETEAVGTEAAAADGDASRAEATLSAEDQGADEAANAPVADDAAGATEEADESAEAGSADTIGPTTTVVEGGLFPAERVERARLQLEEPPTAEQAAEIVLGELLEPDLSACGEVVIAPEGTELIGFVPIMTGDQKGEVLAYRSPAGDEAVAVVVDESCREPA